MNDTSPQVLMRFRLLSTLPLFLVACSLSNTGSQSQDVAEGAASSNGFALYPDVRPGMRRLGELSPQDTSIGDFGTAVRNQGTIASCASFGFLGLLENQMFRDRGVRVDLSERFMIFSNYFQTGTLGGSPEVITKFPSLIKNVGLLPDPLYPYAAVLPNANRFGQDAAQGLTNDPNAPPELASVVEPTPALSAARSEIMQRDEFLGKLPAGPYPIMLPVRAGLLPNHRNPELELDGKIYRCFAEGGPESVPPSQQLAVSPREYLEMCFDLDPSAYVTCGFDAEATANAIEGTLHTTDQCEGLKQVADGVGAAMAAANAKSLKLTLALLDQGQASLLGVTAPASPDNVRGVWSSVFGQGAGHAVLAIGYLTYDELASGEEQPGGVLATGIFDKLAASVEPAYADKLAAGLPTDKAALRDARLGSRLAIRMKSEGGIVLFRNSWGASIPIQGGGTMSIGIDGHQAMTFDFYLKNAIIMQSRSNLRVQGVDWQVGAGPAYCPSNVQVAQGGDWISSPEAVAGVKERMRKLVVPETCP